MDFKISLLQVSNQTCFGTPKSLAPTLFKKSEKKEYFGKKALQDNRWINHITPVITPQEICHTI
jgi:hypothetical protein